MPRTVKISEQEQAERDAAARKDSRKTGFQMMEIRDKGWGKLSNGVVFIWSVDKANRSAGVLYQDVPEGHFVLSINGKDILFNIDEFQRYLRWG